MSSAVQRLACTRGLAWSGLLVALACSPGSGTPAADGRLVTSSLQGPGSGSAPFLGRVPAAPFEVAYHGTRRVEHHFQVGPAWQTVVFREEVGGDGAGRFAVRATEVLQSSTLDDQSFLMLQRSRASFIYRYRDFRIRDLDRFLENYTLRLLDDSVEVAGVDCVELRVDRSAPWASTYYTACFDPATGLVLRWQEKTYDGVLLARVEFEDFQLGIEGWDLDATGASFREKPLDTGADFVEEVGFVPLEPTLLPTGYVLQQAFRLEDPSGYTWLKLVYGDGADQVVFVQRAHEEIGGVVQASQGDVIEHARVGPWNLAQGEVRGHPVILMGKVPATELFELLQSALTTR